MKRMMIALVLALLVAGCYVGCTALPTAPEMGSVTVVRSNEDAKPSKGEPLYSQTFSAYAEPSVVTCKIRGYLCGAVVKVYAGAQDYAGLTGGPQGKTTLGLPAGRWRTTVTYSRQTSATATENWCYDGWVTIPGEPSWLVLPVVRC